MSTLADVRTSLSLHPRKRLPLFAKQAADLRRKRGVERWRALGRERFRALIASPSEKPRRRGASISC